MSDFLKLIQNVSTIYGIDKPANFTEASGADYDEIRLYIQQAARAIYFTKGFRFRERNSDLYTIADQNEYDQIYGIIEQMVQESYTYPMCYTSDYIAILTNAIRTTIPSYAVRNDKLIIYPTPSESGIKITILWNAQTWAVTAGGYGVGTEKTSMTLETDEPNFPEIHHDIVEFKALLDLFAGGPAEKQKSYYNKYYDKLGEVSQESIQSREASPRMQMPNNYNSTNRYINDFFRNTV